MNSSERLPRIALTRGVSRATMICATVFVLTVVTSSAPKPGIKGQSNDCEQLRRNVQQLNADLDQLKRRVADLDRYRQIDYTRDLLTKEEQRAEALQNQIQDNSDKMAPLQARMDQIDEQLRPENIDQSLAGVGSMRPEEAKEALRRRLTNDKRRVQTQIDLLNQNHTRLTASLAGSDASIQRLRLRLTEISHP
jgi:chromosome segregation ATPase